MIVSLLPDSSARAVLRAAARPDEDVLFGRPETSAGLHFGFPRLLVLERPSADVTRDGSGRPVPWVAWSRRTLGRWQEEWRVGDRSRPWTATASVRLGAEIAAAAGPTWIDHTLSELAGAVGRPLPPAFMGFARRSLDYPHRYAHLSGLARVTGLSVGALKGRFGRRALPSPSAYLRWLRCLAVAHLLCTEGMTTLGAVHRLGWSNSGNLCRKLRTATGMAPTDLRRSGGRERLMMAFTERMLGPLDLARWDSLGGVFTRRAA